jgi:DNA-binding GntR family transcriptional regulator
MMELVISGDGDRAAELMRNHIRLSLTASAIEVLEGR